MPNTVRRNSQDKFLREHLLHLLKGGSAHAKFDDVVAGIPAKLRGQKPAGMPHSAWMLLEHMRIGQWDILEFSRNRETRLASLAQRILAAHGRSAQHRRMER